MPQTVRLFFLQSAGAALEDCGFHGGVLRVGKRIETRTIYSLPQQGQQTLAAWTNGFGSLDYPLVLSLPFQRRSSAFNVIASAFRSWPGVGGRLQFVERVAVLLITSQDKNFSMDHGR
jgi:hypothetical protein